MSHCEEAVQHIEQPEAETVVSASVVEELPEEEEEAAREIVVETAAIDPRFPATNQARHCFVKYNEAHKCFAEHGEEATECAKLARDYRTMCPVEWVERWNEAREDGTWWGKY